MPDIVSTKGNYTLDFIMVPSEHIDKFNEFMMQYGDKSDYEIFSEIAKVKGELSQDLLNQHISNLDSLSQMNGFITDLAHQRIAAVKEVLHYNSDQSEKSNVDSQFFFGGTSLLLWFLTLAAIWRRPFGGGRGGFRRPGFGRPYF